MLGVTTHISTDLASDPAALGAAARRVSPDVRRWSFSRATVVLADAARSGAACLHAGGRCSRSSSRCRRPWLIPLHLAAFFVAALTCHDALARSRPPARDLTAFYVWMSVGGMLGGVFNTLVAPHLFTGIFEYPIVLALACLARSSPAIPSPAS